MHKTKAKWLFIHTKHDFYMDTLWEYNIMFRPHGYSQRFGKNRDHSGAQVEHMYVTNYEDDMTLHRVSNSSLQNLLDHDRIVFFINETSSLIICLLHIQCPRSVML